MKRDGRKMEKGEMPIKEEEIKIDKEGCKR